MPQFLIILGMMFVLTKLLPLMFLGFLIAIAVIIYYWSN